MTVDQHKVSDPPLPGGVRAELVQGTVTLTTGTATETINVKLDYASKPTITASAGNGATDEQVDATIQDDDPTSDGTITIRVDGATNEDKEYHVQVLDLPES